METKRDALVPVLASRVIPRTFLHGFTTREGGVSGPPFESLNLGMKWGDSRENVLENRRRVGIAHGGGPLLLASQVHGARVLRVRGDEIPSQVAAWEADGLCSDRTGFALAVLVADCVPLVLADERTGAFAAVHAGWRGTVAGIVEAAVEVLAREFGSRPEDMRAALGPAIGACCFEVGPEVVEAFVARTPAGEQERVIVPASPRPRIDLRAAQRMTLKRAGLAASSIEVETACTKCDPAGRFYSYRRDGSHTGQHMGIIARTGLSGA